MSRDNAVNIREIERYVCVYAREREERERDEKRLCSILVGADRPKRRLSKTILHVQLKTVID